jgi:hypothetical protein
MGKPLVERIPFEKILIGFAVCAFISLGLCGADLVLEMRMTEYGNNTMQGILSVGGLVGLIGMLLSAVGIVLTAIIWIFLFVFKSSSSKEKEQQ